MAGAIKGITIEFRGDTTSLDRALSNVKKEAKGTANELKYIDKAIKFNPTSVDAWRQKQIVLNKAINETKEKLSLMKQGLREMEAQGLNAENSEEFRRMQREIDQTERHLKSLQAELRSIGNINLRAASEQFKQWGTSLENAGQKMRGLSMAAATVTASIGALTVKSGRWADDLNTMSKRYGVGTQELQKYSIAADLVDTSTEAIVKSQTRLKKSMLSAEQGSKNQTAAFDKLGVSVTNADGSLRDGEAVWQDTIKALGKMTNETERDALAMQLMGKSANELNPLIEDGGETYKRLAETMQKYGLDFIDQETLDNANKFNDELDTIKAIGLVTFQSLGAQLAGYLAPALEKVVGAVGKFAQWLSTLSPKTLTVIASIAGFVAVLSPLLIGLGKMSFAISSILGVMAKVSGLFASGGTAVGIFGKALALITGPVGIVVAAVGALTAVFIHLWNTNEEFRTKMIEIWTQISETIGTFIEGIKTRFSELIEIFTGGSGSIKAAWDTFCNYLAPAFELAFSTIATIISTVAQVILGALDVFIAIFKGDWQGAWEAVKGIFIAVWSAIQSHVTAVLGFIRTIISTQIGLIKTVITTAWNLIKDTTLKAWNAVKSAIVDPIKTAVTTLQSMVDKIKSFFPIKLGKILNFSLPKISVSSKTVKVGDKEVKVPSFDISWASHAAGGIFDRPTLLTDRNGGLHQVGEAGAEAIIPLDRFWNTLENNNQRTDSILEAQTGILIAMLEQLQAEKDFRIDGRVAGRIVNDLVRV